MNYYEQDDRRGRVWGIVGVVFYSAVCVGVMFATHTIDLPQMTSGIVVDFGSGEWGLGESDPAVGQVDTRPATPQPAAPDAPVLTADEPDAPAIVAVPQPVTTPATPEPAPEPVREVDRRALFPGTTAASTVTSQGTAGGEGNQGAREGTAGGSIEGVAVSGREVIRESLEKPDYPKTNEEARINIRIVIDSEGIVTNANFEPIGSSNPRTHFIEAAQTAALKARFNRSDNISQGTITYIFKLN